jgi:glutamine synthetase
MPQELRHDVIQKIKDQKIEFVHLWFTDVLGFLKAFTMDVEELENAMTEGMGFDGSSIQGFARIEESDMIAYPRSHDAQDTAVEAERPGRGHDVLRHRPS